MTLLLVRGTPDWGLIANLARYRFGKPTLALGTSCSDAMLACGSVGTNPAELSKTFDSSP